MIQALLDVMLGEWGRAARDFYFTNQTTFNIIFLIWGGIITYSSFQLNNIRRKTVHLGVSLLEEKPHLSDEEAWVAFRPKWQEEINKLNPRWILNRWNIWVSKATPENIIEVMKLGPEWFAALRNGEVLRYRFSLPGENYKLSMFIKNKPQ